MLYDMPELQVNVGLTGNSFDPFGIKVNLIRVILMAANHSKLQKKTIGNEPNITLEIKGYKL